MRLTLRFGQLVLLPKVCALLPLVALAATACRWTDALLTVHDADVTSASHTDGGMDGSACANHQASGGSAGLTDSLVVWYQCESAAGTSGTLLLDSSGHGNDGTLLAAGDGGLGYNFAAGKVGNALDLVYANSGFVALPAGLLADACEATIATWVYLNSGVKSWMRIFDFGIDRNVYMFLTPINSLDNVARFGISVRGNAHEDDIKAQAAMPTLAWTHVAVVLGASGGTLYFNGLPVGTNSSMTLRPADLGRTVNDYIGRSEFVDPYLDGNIDEFRIYRRALSPDEIQALANGS